MNKKFLAATLAGFLFAAQDAGAFYVGIAGGNSRTKIEDTKIGSGNSFTIAAGIGLPIPLFSIRAEAEYLNLRSSDDDFSARTHGLAANGYLNLPLLPIVRPYLGFGLANLKQKSFGETSSSKITPQYMAGLDISIPLLPIAAGIEYRYIDTKFDYDGLEASSKVRTALAKIRYTF